MKNLKINCPDGYIVDQEKSDLEKGIIEFKKIEQITHASIVRNFWAENREPCWYITPNGKLDTKDSIHLKGDDGNFSTTNSQLISILALNKLCNVAKYLNGDWLPDWNDDGVCKVYIQINHQRDALSINMNSFIQPGHIYFKSEELAKQAIEILGEEEIRDALTLNH